MKMVKSLLDPFHGISTETTIEGNGGISSEGWNISGDGGTEIISPGGGTGGIVKETGG